jgi:dTDP-4-dehydrorhamnose reductase
MNKQEVYLADDVSFSPTYNIDVSKRMKEIIEKKLEYGIYHIANSGIGSLYDIIIEMMANLNYRSKYIKKGSYLNYSSKYRRDVHSIIKSVKLEEMRHWKDAMREYCNELKTI